MPDDEGTEEVSQQRGFGHGQKCILKYRKLGTTLNGSIRPKNVHSSRLIIESNIDRALPAKH